MNNKLILGVDAGNYRVKVAGEQGILQFSSAISDWFERDIIESYFDDIEFKIGNRRGFAGNVAEYEDSFGESMFGDSKAHEDTKIRVLLNIFNYMKTYSIKAHNISIVVGQPISQHKEPDKDFIKKMLLGYHEYEVNGHPQSIRIEEVGVAAEGSSAFWSNPVDGLVRIIDGGSGTINLASVHNKRHVNTSSDTLNFGCSTGKSKQDTESIARGIIRGSTRLQWNRSDEVYICGGISDELTPLIQQHYVNAKVMKPILQSNIGDFVVDSTYGNAVGFYNIARRVFT